MTEPIAVTLSPHTMTFLLSLVAALISGLGVVCAWRQIRASQAQLRTQEQGQRFVELRETYTARIDTLSAMVNDLQEQVRALQAQNRILADHAERCEEQLRLLHRRMGGEGPSRE